ncbi:hypothetical protein [Modestobacter sp. SYSU DS0511]
MTREVWRPFLAFGAIAGAVLVAGFVAWVSGSILGLQVANFVAVVCVATACVRALIWWLVPARVVVSHDDSGLFVRRGGKLLRDYPWADIQEVRLVWGDRWPEWNRWATFPCLSVVLRGEPGAVNLSPSFLLVRVPDVEKAERELEGVVQRHLDAGT